METLIRSFFNLDILAQAWPILLSGFWITVLLTLLVVPLGTFGGLAVALVSTSRNAFAPRASARLAALSIRCDRIKIAFFGLITDVLCSLLCLVF